MRITDIKAIEILDSRGNPTVSCSVKLSDGSKETLQCLLERRQANLKLLNLGMEIADIMD